LTGKRKNKTQPEKVVRAKKRAHNNNVEQAMLINEQHKILTDTEHLSIVDEEEIKVVSVEISDTRGC